MGFPIPILDAVIKVVDKLIPDPAAKAAAQLEVLKLQQAGEFKEIDAELQVTLGQLAINQAEATNPDRWVSGARPSVIWVCSAGLAWAYLIHPLIQWIAFLASYDVGQGPSVDTASMMPLLTSLLGLGAMRSFDKAKGTA